MKYSKILYALPVLMLASCSEEFHPGPEAVPGEDVVFHASLADATRTEYGELGTNDRPVYWVNGDLVRVFSPQCEASFQNKQYRVETAGPGQDYATDLVKNEPAGLRWGTAPAEETQFFATYPDAPISQESNGDIIASMRISETQNSLMTKKTVGGTTTYLPSRMDMENNVMYAQPIAGKSQVTTDGNGNTVANLQFTPYSTVLHLSFEGWALTDPNNVANQNGMVVNSVIIRDAGTSSIAGNFSLRLKADGSAPEMNPRVSLPSSVITCNLKESEDMVGISLNPGDKFECDVFMLPIANQKIDKNWSISLVTSAGTYTRQFSPKDGANMTLLPGQIHKITVPAITVDNGWEYHPDSWLADIPDNVYFTEVSLPGSWYSASTSGKDIYQSDDIATQFSKGVRAFFLETRVGTSGGDYTLGSGLNITPQARLNDQLNRRNSDSFTVVVSGTGQNQSIYGDLNAYYSATTINATLTAIAEQVQKNPTELAVLTLSYADGGTAGVSGFWKSVWLQKIFNAINANALFKQYLYTGTVNESTVISALRGKILLKINVDDESEITSAYTTHGGVGGIGAATNTTVVDQQLFSQIPALFSYTNQSWSATTAESSLVSNLYWKGKPTLEGATIGRTGFFWNYTMANRTYGSGLPTLANRRSSISNLIANSKDARAQGEHNVFFMIGAGGSYFNSTSSDTGSPTTVANNLNPFLLEKINEKITNGEASPLGLVYTNFTTGESGQQVVDAIIRMNRRFKLLEINGGSEQTDVKSAVSTHSSGFKKPAGNGWNAF